MDTFKLAFKKFICELFGHKWHDFHFERRYHFQHFGPDSCFGTYMTECTRCGLIGGH